MDSFDDTELALMKFGVGQPVPRMEDPTLLRGRGRYTDDINLPGQAHAVMVRSKHAHGVLKGIDGTAAAKMPGVLAILTYADIEAAGFGPGVGLFDHLAERFAVGVIHLPHKMREGYWFGRAIASRKMREWSCYARRGASQKMRVGS